MQIGAIVRHYNLSGLNRAHRTGIEVDGMDPPCGEWTVGTNGLPAVGCAAPRVALRELFSAPGFEKGCGKYDGGGGLGIVLAVSRSSFRRGVGV